jgi:uncharacterized protein (TIGR00295 family)
VPGHCLAVEGLATAMCERAEAVGLPVDRTVVQCACILHDVGRAVAQDVRHAGIGADMLRKDGDWDPRLVLAVERHTGGGIDATEAARLGLPAKNYTPRSLEERIVCHADNLFSGTKRIGLAALKDKYEAKGLAAAWEKIHILHHDLGKLLATDLETLKPVDLAPP